jgi:acetyl esterase/lipase
MAAKPPPDIKREKVDDAGGVEAEWITAPSFADDRYVLFRHGGRYVLGSTKTHLDLMGSSCACGESQSSRIELPTGP